MFIETSIEIHNSDIKDFLLNRKKKKKRYIYTPLEPFDFIILQTKIKAGSFYFWPFK